MLTYTYRYNRIIKWFKDHPISKENCQCEKHHIIPRSCGGLDIEENLVMLPLRWHYIVHCWLPMVYAEAGMQKEYNAMLYAWNRFQNYTKGFREGLKTIKEDSLLYQKLRQEYISLVSSTIGEKLEGKRNGRYNTHWWKDPNDKTKTLAIKEGDPIPEGWIRGRWIESGQFESQFKGKIGITDGRHYVFVDSEKDIPQGWKRGIPKRSISSRRKMSESAKKRMKKFKEELSPIMRERLLPLFECFYSEGFKAVQEKFGYRYTSVNLCQQFRKYLPKEYKSKKKNHNKFG